MDLSKLKNKTHAYLQKYKYVLLILLLGVSLLLMPTGTSKVPSKSVDTHIAELTHISQHDLASILENIKGAGRVKVLLSLENSAQTDYQLNIDNGNSVGGRQTTVTVTDGDRKETGLIRKTSAPIYRGAIIICDGADNPIVHLSIINAVANITGLRTNQISVLKMQ